MGLLKARGGLTRAISLDTHRQCHKLFPLPSKLTINTLALKGEGGSEAGQRDERDLEKSFKSRGEA